MPASFTATFGGSSTDVGYAAQQTSDGGYVLVGLTMSNGAFGGDVWLVKTDASGNRVWDKTFGGIWYDAGYSVAQTSDGGYVASGYTDSYGAGGHDVWLIKTDALGNKVWDKTFGGAHDDVAYSAQQTSDGGYILAGYTSSVGAGYNDVWLVKTDANGDKVWGKVFGGAGHDEGYSVQQTADGGYIVVGRTNSFGAGGHDVWLVKTDASGDEVFDRTFGRAANDEGKSVLQASDGGYIITGSLDGYHSVWLIKTDTTGKRLWDRVLGEADRDEGHSVQQTSDGGYVIVGSVGVRGREDCDVWLIKIDSLGNGAWDRTFGGMRNDEGQSVQQTSDGGYVITGYTDSYGAGGQDFWLIKTDAEGN